MSKDGQITDNANYRGSPWMLVPQAIEDCTT